MKRQAKPAPVKIGLSRIAEEAVHSIVKKELEPIRYVIQTIANTVRSMNEQSEVPPPEESREGWTPGRMLHETLNAGTHWDDLTPEGHDAWEADARYRMQQQERGSYVPTPDKTPGQLLHEREHPTTKLEWSAQPEYFREAWEKEARVRAAVPGRSFQCHGDGDSELEKLQRENEDLRQWKKSMLEVTASCDFQEVGRLLLMPAGTDIPPNLEGYVRRLVVEVSEIRAQNTVLHHRNKSLVADCDRQGEALGKIGTMLGVHVGDVEAIVKVAQVAYDRDRAMHALEQAIDRGVSPDRILTTLTYIQS